MIISENMKTMCPAFSIIIPHKDIPDLLMRCLRSIPVSEDIQVIVVDDNSADADTYLERYPELSRPYIEFIRTTKGGGAGFARNVGLDYAKGKWLLFADADDFFVNDFERILEKYKNGHADLVFFNAIGVFSNDIKCKSNRGKQLLFEKYHKSGDINIFRYGDSVPWGKMFSSRLIKDYSILFDETPVANDYMFSVKTGVLAKEIKADSTPIYVVTVREHSLSYLYADTKEKLLIRFDVSARIYKFLKEHGYGHVDPRLCNLSARIFRRYPFLFLRKMIWLHNNGIGVMNLLPKIMYIALLPKYRKVSKRKTSYRPI